MHISKVWFYVKWNVNVDLEIEYLYILDNGDQYLTYELQRKKLGICKNNDWKYQFPI